MKVMIGRSPSKYNTNDHTSHSRWAYLLSHHTEFQYGNYLDTTKDSCSSLIDAGNLHTEHQSLPLMTKASQCRDPQQTPWIKLDLVPRFNTLSNRCVFKSQSN